MSGIRFWNLTGWLLLAAAPGYAADAQVWHWWTNEIGVTDRVSVIIHGQHRTNRFSGDFLQGRTGPILRYKVTKKTTLISGYYYRREPEPRRDTWGDSHRLFGGIENYADFGRYHRLPASRLESRLLVERFFNGPAGTLTDYTRLRHRHRFSFTEWTVSPLLGYEVLAWREGLWGQRPHGGIRWQVNSSIMLDMAYQWDGRVPGAGSRNQLIFTNLFVRFGRKPSADYPNRPPF